MNTVTDKSPIIERIQKLLALSGNNSSVNEAQAALLMAQKLLVRHNLDMADVGSIRPPVENIDEKLIYSSGRAENWRVILASVIAANFRCKVYTSRIGITQIFFVGHSTDISIAVNVYHTASLMAEAGAEKFAANYPTGSRRRIGTDFKSGFVVGLRAQFEKQKNDNGWGLILATPKDVENKLMQITKGNKGASRGLQARSHDAFHEGKRKGESFASGYETKRSTGPKLLK